MATLTMDAWLTKSLTKLVSLQKVWQTEAGGLPTGLMTKVKGIIDEGGRRYGDAFYAEADISKKLLKLAKGPQKKIARQLVQLSVVRDKGVADMLSTSSILRDQGQYAHSPTGLTGRAAIAEKTQRVVASRRVSPSQAMVPYTDKTLGGTPKGMITQYAKSQTPRVSTMKALEKASPYLTAMMFGAQGAKTYSEETLARQENEMQMEAMDQMMTNEEGSRDNFYQAMLPMAQEQASNSYQAVLQQLLGGRGGARLVNGETEIGG